jgi:hypothetical protein
LRRKEAGSLIPNPLPLGGSAGAEPKRVDVGYRELAERMKKHGMTKTEASIANKVSRATFSATFMLTALIAIGAEVVRLEYI